MSTSHTAEKRSRYRGFESIPIPLTVRVGWARLRLARLAELAEGDVLVLDRTVGTPFDLISGGLLLGRVEPVLVDEAVAYKLVSVVEREDDAVD